MTNVTHRPQAQALALAFAALALSFVALRPEAVDAQRAQRGQRAQRAGHAAAYIVQAQVPRDMEVNALLSFGRSHAARRIQETSGGPINERMWIAKLIVNLGRPLGDVQYDVLYYDVTHGRTLVTTQEVFVNDRTQQAFVNPIRLRRSQFSPGQHIEAVVTIRRQEIATARTELQGEVPRSSGEVDFTAGGDAAP